MTVQLETKRLSLALLLLLGAIIWSCDRENIDSLTELPEPVNPTIVETNETFVAYRSVDNQLIQENGLGYRLLPDFPYYAVSSDSITCDGDGGSTLRFSDISSYFLNFFRSDTTYRPLTSILVTVNEQGDTTYLQGGLLVHACESIEPQLTITEESDTMLRGTYTGEFFRSVAPQDSTSQELCDYYESVGALTAEFAVPLVDCQ